MVREDLSEEEVIFKLRSDEYGEASYENSQRGGITGREATCAKALSEIST